MDLDGVWEFGVWLVTRRKMLVYFVDGKEKSCEWSRKMCVVCYSEKNCRDRSPERIRASIRDSKFMAMILGFEAACFLNRNYRTSTGALAEY